jgi:hypothetical protein
MIRKMNKRADTLLDVLLWILLGIIIFLLIMGIMSFLNDSPNNPNKVSTCEKKCRSECQKFDYTFYKIENCYLRWENCW